VHLEGACATEAAATAAAATAATTTTTTKLARSPNEWLKLAAAEE
jgi:hypothetical protein